MTLFDWTSQTKQMKIEETRKTQRRNELELFPTQKMPSKEKGEDRRSAG